MHLFFLPESSLRLYDDICTNTLFCDIDIEKYLHFENVSMDVRDSDMSRKET